MKPITSQNILDTLEHRKPIRQHVREFAYIFVIIALVYGTYQLYTQSTGSHFFWSVAVAAVLFFLGDFAPIILYPVWKVWMAIATALGFIVTSIVLTIMWLGVFMPLALILKIVGKKVMDLSFDRSRASYWNDRNEKYHDFKLLERQF